MSRIRVALADDQTLVRAGFRVLVNGEDDMEVVGEAADGAAAVELVRSTRADVVLMDIRMPGMDGLEATRRIADDDDLVGVRVLILTTFDLDEYVFEALRAGAAPMSIKPYSRRLPARRATTVQPRKGSGWVYLPFRVLVSAAGVLLFNQAVFAGQFLSGTFGALHTHRENATIAGIVVLGAALAAVLIRWPGRGPIWPIFACLGLFGLVALQIVLGFARVLTVHVPLGVSIIVLAVLLVIWAWRPHRVPAGPTAEHATVDTVAAATQGRS